VKKGYGYADSTYTKIWIFHPNSNFLYRIPNCRNIPKIKVSFKSIMTNLKGVSSKQAKTRVPKRYLSSSRMDPRMAKMAGKCQWATPVDTQ